MELKIREEILNAYGFASANISLKQIGSGHINRTYLLFDHIRKAQFILQNINTDVFKDPFAIANNINAVANYLKNTAPNYVFPAPIATVNGDLMCCEHNAYWRLLPFISHTIALDSLTDPNQAYEAAKQFGMLSKLLKDFDASNLKPTIQGFHDLSWRYDQFTFALANAEEKFLSTAEPEIEMAIQHHDLVAYSQSLQRSEDFPTRVMHHDTKISNVLLDAKDNHGICVIDLDTLMPGKFVSDLGDMMRTYLCAYAENETDLTKVILRFPYFEATIKGYLSEMAEVLTAKEKEMILFSGKHIIYMQALRFLTDFLSGSTYYPISYASQNLDRAKNQFKLLSELFENEKVLEGIIQKCLS
jgi:thiamine kinase-like enzyme